MRKPAPRAAQPRRRLPPRAPGLRGGGGGAEEVGGPSHPNTAVAGAEAGEGSDREPGPVLPETRTSSSSSTQALRAPRGPAPTPAC